MRREPLSAIINRLTIAQRREINNLQVEGKMFIEPGMRHRVFKGLVTKGIAEMICETRRGDYFRLHEPWRSVDVDRKYRIGELREIGQPEKRAIMEKPPLPDPPKKTFTRPPAVYSNKSWEQRIDEILNTENGK